MVDKLLERVEGWRALAKDNKDPFIRFISEYIAFNALLRRKYGYKTGDGNLIKCIKEDLPERLLLSNEISGAVDELKNMLPIYNVRDVKRGNGRGEISEKDVESDIKMLIDVIYTIRNNLFHGDKRYYNEDEIFNRDEKFVKLGYEILKEINNWLIENLQKRECGR